MKKAQSLIEYAIILILISAVAVIVLYFLGQKATFKNASKNQTINNEIVETMTRQCKKQNMIYNKEKGICEIDTNTKEIESK